MSASNTTSRKLPASLSLDLDNLWCYLKVHGEPEWCSYPSYISKAIPIILDFLEAHGQKITFFVVGEDARREENVAALAQIIQRGHEIGNHSISHESWMHTYSEERIMEEIGGAHDLIQSATGFAPQGFRGPGFAYSPTMLNVLKRLGYQYDASLLPSIIGPLARLYYMWGSRMSRHERAARSNLFGRASDGFLPLKPFQWKTDEGELLEIPVTVIPMLRTPFHMSYLIWLSQFSTALALSYFRTGLALCRLHGVEPSFLLHPLDFLGAEDVKGLEFFPGMQLSRQHKLNVAGHVLSALQKSFDVLPMNEYAKRAQARSLKSRIPLPFESQPHAQAVDHSRVTELNSRDDAPV